MAASARPVRNMVAGSVIGEESGSTRVGDHSGNRAAAAHIDPHMIKRHIAQGQRLDTVVTHSVDIDTILENTVVEQLNGSIFTTIHIKHDDLAADLVVFIR